MLKKDFTHKKLPLLIFLLAFFMFIMSLVSNNIGRDTDSVAKKAVLKRVLKYAPLKSDFVRAAVQDEVVKNGLSSDMYDVPNENIIDAEYTDIPVDQETGEVIEQAPAN